jgi:glutaredoxin 3
MSTSSSSRGLSMGPEAPYNLCDLALDRARKDITMTARVEIYTTQYCGYCGMAKTLLTKKKIAFDEIAVDGNPALRAEMMERSGGGTTVPQIFIGKTHVGGCDDLYARDHAGGLDKLLASEAASS